MQVGKAYLFLSRVYQASDSPDVQSLAEQALQRAYEICNTCHVNRGQVRSPFKQQGGTIGFCQTSSTCQLGKIAQVTLPRYVAAAWAVGESEQFTSSYAEGWRAAIMLFGICLSHGAEAASRTRPGAASSKCSCSHVCSCKVWLHAKPVRHRGCHVTYNSARCPHRATTGACSSMMVGISGQCSKEEARLAPVLSLALLCMLPSHGSMCSGMHKKRRVQSQTVSGQVSVASCFT